MKRFSKIAALFLGVVLTFVFVSCETEADNSLALAALALSSGSSGAVNPSTENTCTITFNANGGSITTATQTVTAGEKTALKSADELGLSRANYAFVGWAVKSDATEAEYNDAAEVTLTADLTLYALWAENVCTVTFNANGGSIMTATQTVKLGAKSKLKSATELGLNRTGYEFAGWATKSDATEAEYADAAEVTLTDNLTLFALWIKLCTITFDANGGSITTAEQTVKAGEKATLKSAGELGLSRANYAFVGWATKSDATEAEYTDAAEATLTDNLTLFALWIKLCTITFDANGGTITTVTQTVTAGEKTALKSATELGLSRTNYAFVGWATKSDATEAEYADAAEVTLTSDLTLFALWIKLCTITFNANGGNITIATQVVKSGVPTKLKSATELGLSRTNYAFVGWATRSGATTAEYADGAEATLSDNLTLYAIWNELPVNEQPLTLEFIDSSTITITNRWSSLKYSINGGDLTDATDSITVAAGDKVCFYAQKSENDLYLQIINCDADCYIYGNIMSLVTLTENGDWNPLETTLFGKYSFGRLFYENCHIKNHASKKLILPAETLADYCYESMFSGCTSLTTAPELKATTLAVHCYSSMFSRCTSLTTAPSLPAETLADYCYESMFSGCTSLTTAPSLPAETLADYCYYAMFSGCTSLTTAPSLPAETLAGACYDSMFSGCTSLTTAPSLPAETLVAKCYYAMFSGCTSLNYIKCLATDVSAYSCTYNWLDGVSSSGKFVKAKDMTSWGSGASGIPIGWTVVDAE